MNGWTPETTLETQARNIIARLEIARPDHSANTRDVGRLLASEGAVTPEFVRKLGSFVSEIETRERAMRNLETYGEAKLARQYGTQL